MTTQLGNLVVSNLDLNLFFSISITENQVRLMGNYSAKIMKHIVSKGFEEYTYLYADNKKMLEFINNNGVVVIICK